MIRGEMIRQAREARGMSQGDLAKATGVSQTAIYKIENGETKKSKYEREIMDFLGIGVEVPVVGYVGAGSEAHFYEDAQGPFDMVNAPEGSSAATVAVKVDGASLGPLLNRSMVFYDRVDRPASADHYNRMCVVGLADGRVLVKELRPSRTKGLFNLISNSTEDPILDVPVLWAARVISIVPR